MANEMKIRITADASQATTIMKATQANINKIIKDQPGLEKAFANDSSQKNLDAINKNLSNVIGLVERAAQAIHMADPTISEAEARAKLYAATMESLGREYGGSATEAMKFLEKLRDIEKATVDAEMNTKKMAVAQNSLATATKTAGTAAKTSSNYFSKLFDTTKNVLVFRAIMKVINSIAGLNNFLKDSVQVAAEAEQVFSKLNTVFGETSGAMSKTISLATKLGTATSTAASALSTVGDLLQAQGQTTLESLSMASEWVSQFQDIIAFKDINMSLEEFAQNFMSGAAGNLRNFRTFGSIVRESAVNAELAKKGLDKLTGSELELAKMTTRAEMALKQQKNAIGATQREWDTMLSTNRRYEESLKSLKENMGNYLEPMTKWWVTLKTAIINAMNAQMEYDKMTGIMRSGTRLESSKPILDENLNFNIENWESFIQELEDINWQARQPDKRMNNVIAAAGKYGATEEYLDLALRTANSAFGVYYSDDEIKKIIDELTAINKSIEKNEKINAEKAENEVYLSSINSFLEKLQEIKVGDTSINFNGNDWYEAFYKEFESFFSGGTTNSTFKQALNNKDLFLWFDDSIEAAISDIEKSAIPKLDELFGEMTNTELLEEQRDAFKTLYEIAYQTGYFTDKQLEEIYNKWEELGIEIDKIKEKENIQQQLGENFSSSFGEFETLVTMWGSLGDVTGGLGSLLGILVDIVAQTEVVTRLGSILTDSILPVLNAFLEPLLPVIDMVSQSISLLVESVLVPFYPILQGLSSILVVVFGLLNAGINYFVDGVKMLAGKVVEGIQSMINGIIDLINNIPFVDIGHVRFKASEWADIDPDKNLEKNLQVMEEQLNRIAGYTMETAENTESDDYETYRRLLQAKEITDEQFKRLTHQDVYSTKTVGNGVTYTSGGKQSYVSINNLAVQVPAGMTLEEFLKNLGDYSNGNLPFGVNTISA